MAIAFPNSLVFPLILLDALCEQDVVNELGENDSIKASDGARASTNTYRAPGGTGKGTSGGGFNLYAGAAAIVAGGTQAVAADQANSVSKSVSHGVEPPEAKPDATTNAARGRKDELKRRCTNSNNAPRVRHSASPVIRYGRKTSRCLSFALSSLHDGRALSVKRRRHHLTFQRGIRRDGGFWARAKQRTWDVVVSPAILAFVAGIICLIAPLQDMLFHNPDAFLRPLGGALQGVGVPTVPVSTLVIAGSLVAVSAEVCT
eukprot:g7603.t1